jgi:Na+-transporting methylmalonyl-CoA/oxaloacetate decarboxylase gamma subunit
MAIATLRELWRRRYAVSIGIAYALALVILMSYRVSLGFPPKIEGRQYDAGIAATDVLVDSPNSQVVDVGGGGGDVEGATIDLGGLSTRARLLASLMSSSPLKDRIASAAGIESKTLIVIAPTGDDLAPRMTPATSTTVKPGDRDASVLGLYVDETLPILTMRVQAPDAGTAERLATSAVSQLGVYLKSVAAADNVPGARQLVVEPLGPATSATVVKGPRRLFAILLGLVVIAIWCVGIVMIPRLVRTWRAAARAEAVQAAHASGADDEHAADVIIAADAAHKPAPARAHAMRTSPKKRTQARTPGR